MKKMLVDGLEISMKQINDADYISLTDMAGRGQRATKTIENWMRTKATLDFLKEWEVLYNPDFNLMKFHEISDEIGRVSFIMSIKEWIETTQAVGIQSRPGRYGGTFAHVDIALEFGTRISPRFKLLLLRDYQRVKAEERRRLEEGWDIARFLTKVSYSAKTAAINENIVPRLNPQDKPFAYANEADMVNLIVFGKTAKQWREEHPEVKGNMRDHAELIELLLLDRLDTINTRLIKEGAGQESRFVALQKFAQFLVEQLTQDKRIGPPIE